MNFYYGDGGTRSSGGFYYKNPKCRDYDFRNTREMAEEDRDFEKRRRNERMMAEELRRNDECGQMEEAEEMERRGMHRCDFCREVFRCLCKQQDNRPKPPICRCRCPRCFPWNECQRPCPPHHKCPWWDERCCFPWHECQKPWPPHINCQCRCNNRTV